VGRFLRRSGRAVACSLQIVEAIVRGAEAGAAAVGDKIGPGIGGVGRRYDRTMRPCP
jgi:hypothetical protein